MWPVVASRTLVDALMKSRLSLGPPKHRFETSSGMKILPISAWSGS